MDNRKIIMPPKTLRTTENGEPVYFNPSQMQLLGQMKRYGMLTSMINAWVPPNDMDRDHYRRSLVIFKNPYPDDCIYASTGALTAWYADIGRYRSGKGIQCFSEEEIQDFNCDNLFTDAHRMAVVKLVTERKIEPASAIDLISGISGEAALLVAEFYEFGVRGKDLMSSGSECKIYTEHVSQASNKFQAFFGTKNPFSAHFSKLFHKNLKSGLTPCAAIQDCLSVLCKPLSRQQENLRKDHQQVRAQ
jgi:hypothetical protein